MKKLSLFLILFCYHAFSQVSTLQSSSDIQWIKLENENFVVVFPDFLQAKAEYTLNLLNHYRKIVSKTYNTQPPKITLVIRPQIAEPNGFVTLAPRRTEWFNNFSFTPIVGSLEWMQALAVHEYRHVVQFETMKKDNMLIPYYIFGEGILGFFMNFVLPSWYFEGDATWAETVYSDAGRGRSPRFTARMKALITSGQKVDYDALLAGDFNTPLPNHYVYGYLLVTRTINIYGPEVWNKIVDYAVARPWNVYALYNGFEEVTGKNFDEFFEETIVELRQKWNITLPSEPKEEFFNALYPLPNDLYIYRDLDGLWELRKKSEQTDLISELNVTPSLSRVDAHENYFIYAQPQPDSRYGYRNYFDLTLMDTQSGKRSFLTKNERFYHPQFSPDGKLIVATHRDEKDQASLKILEIPSGKVLRTITPKDDNIVFSEAVWRNNTELVILTLSNDGMKYLTHYYIQTQDEVPLTPKTRNNLYSLHHFEDQVYFEADDAGLVNIFAFNLKNYKLSKCTDETIGAYQPRVLDGFLHYTADSAYGKRLRAKQLSCKEKPLLTIFGSYDYLGSTPSDSYVKSAPVLIDNYENFYERRQLSSPYDSTEGLFSPHSWSFFGGRGFQLQGQSNNLLGTQALNGYVGITSEEGQPFAGLAYSYTKFYPIFGLGIDYVERSSTLNGQDFEWTEMNALASISLPYTHRSHVYNGTHILTLYGQAIHVTENDFQANNRLNDDQLQTKAVAFSSSISKQTGRRQLLSPWSYNLNLEYVDIAEGNYFGAGRLALTTPGFIKDDGFFFGVSHEYRPAENDLYQLNKNYILLNGYTFSRGYAYEFSEKFTKLTLEYVTPLFYPNGGLSDWIYFNRIYAKIFGDTTTANIYQEETLSFEEETLNSYGVEFYFNSNTLRKFPFTYGLRVFHQQQEQRNAGEFFVSLGL